MRDRKEAEPKAAPRGHWGAHCKITEPPVMPDGTSLAVRVVPTTKVFSAEGYVTGAGYAIESVDVDDKDHAAAAVAGQSSDYITFTASGIATEYGKRICRAVATFTDENLGTDSAEIPFVVMPQKVTFDWSALGTAIGGTCAGCANANRVFTLEYNTVVANTWGQLLSTSSPDQRICYAPCVRFDLGANTAASGVVTLTIKPTFTSPSVVVRYSGAWDYVTWPISIPKTSSPSCTNWPDPVLIYPV